MGLSNQREMKEDEEILAKKFEYFYSDKKNEYNFQFLMDTRMKVLERYNFLNNHQMDYGGILIGIKI